MFITFEGVDGVGKTTQVALLRDYLAAKQYNVLCTREPGGCEFSEGLRPILKQQNLKHTSELLLQLASRSEHIRQTIVSAKQNRKIILCDRFFDSTVAYQCFGIMSASEVSQKANKQVCDYISDSLRQNNDLGYYTKMLLQKALEAELIPGNTIPLWQDGAILRKYDASGRHNNRCLSGLRDFLLENNLNQGMEASVWQKFSDEIVFDAKKFVFLVNFLRKTQQAVMGVMPDATFFFDLDWNDGFASRQAKIVRQDKYHLKGSAHRFLVGLGYRWICAKENHGGLGRLPRRKFYRINASNKSIDDVHQDLIKITDGLLLAFN